MDAKGATVKNNNMNRYIVKANNEPQISMDKITYAIEYIHSCMGKKDWNLFFINNNYSIYDTEEEKIKMGESIAHELSLLADIMIRVMDLAAFKGIDLEKHIDLKMKYNSLRPHKHGKKY